MIRDELNYNDSVEPNTKEIEKLKSNFPQFFSKDGKFLVERFNEMLSEQNIDLDREGYELKFLGKSYAKYLTGTKTTTVLTPDIEHNTKDINNKSENLYIIGDNLDAIKQLVNSYSNKIKCIYIDPPYNTGSDGFVYPDNFKFTKDSLADAIGIEVDEAERILNMAGKSTHSAWLTFMYPRLMLARDLLTDDGVIFISIDEEEMANLQLLCDEIFGEENKIGEIVRNTNSSKNQALFLSTSHDYCLVYGKNMNRLTEKHSENKWAVPKNNIKEYLDKVKFLKKQGLSNEEITAELKILTKYPRFIDFENYWYFDDRGLYRKDNLGGVKNGNMEPIINPLTGKEDPVPPGGYRHNKDKIQELIDDDRIHFDTEGNLPTIKRYLFENMNQRPKAIMSDDQRPDDSLMKEFKTPFDNPKQLAFMKRILSIVDKDSIILDFFSGSSTTAHAVMQLNAEDQGSRKYIMVQLPEQIEKDKPAYKAGYRTIDELGRTRIEKAAIKIKKETDAKIDYGYKLYRLNEPDDNMLHNILEFDPYNTTIFEDMTEGLTFDGVPGHATILSTWMNMDGYGLTTESQRIRLNQYEVDLVQDSLYIIDPGLDSEDVMELIKLIETNEVNISRIVLYPYSIVFNVLHELKRNITNLRNNKNVSLIERY
ncbi:adenine-specific DNA-methyltransferase [Gracilibacillus ureilyticus]|uniref:Adenine-specific DNA-methyltransferase n=1 Tax=Gracilibacillus ureilyticus TaxID=531814 RepID=A0A1H9W529_9BACI|nr:site-specific DNA-methyltransferase [Gracilibacillus ureilyticus]SES28899.1 adenine-specific DNA-methyltransferase [Gracilibacillus ureilyticus]